MTEVISEVMNLAIVCRVVDISPHPNADRLDLLQLAHPQRHGRIVYETLVVGKHYRVGDLGVWLKPGARIAARMAGTLWMPGGTDGEFEVRNIEIRGVPSPGLWAGEWYRNDKHVTAVFNSAARNRGADRISEDGWLHWMYWRDDQDWRPGDIVDEVLCLRSSTEEQLTISQQDVDGQDARETTVRGSNPAAGLLT